MPYGVFISYSQDDSGLCDDVKGCLDRMGYEVFVDRMELAAGPEWRCQLEEVLSQKDIPPYVVLLATRAAMGRPDRVQEELCLAVRNKLDIIAIEFDAGAVKHLQGTRKHQYIQGYRNRGNCLVDDRIENELRKALNYRVRKELERRRTAAANWIKNNNLLPEPSFWHDTWQDHFRIGNSSGERQASVVLTARGGSGKSVLIAHYVNALLEDPTNYPFVLTAELLKDATSLIPRLLGARSALELPAHVEALAKMHRQHVVFVVDGLDQVVISGDPGQAKLIEALNLLANSARLIIGCRKEYWDTVYAKRVSAREKKVDELDVPQITHFLGQYPHLKFDPSNALLRIPFFLGLTLNKAKIWQNVPKTEIAFLQCIWDDALIEASSSGRGEIQPGYERILRRLAELQLKELTYEVPRDELKAASGLGDVFERGLRGLKAKGLVVERTCQGGLFVRLRHDLLDSFAMVRVLLDTPDHLEQCKLLCRRADKDCGWTVLAMLLRAYHAYGQEQQPHEGYYQQLQRALFEEFLFILDHKQFSTGDMARAWAVTHILKDCFPLLFPLICETLAGRRVLSLRKQDPSAAHARASHLGPDACLTQETASTLASAFMVLQEGTAEDAKRAVPILANGLNTWDLKARFLGALAKYHTDDAFRAVVDFGGRQLAEKSDKESLLYVAQALKHFDEPSVIWLLRAIHQDDQLESKIRRVAAENLSHLRPGSVVVPERDEEEIIDGLRPKERGRDHYSDWNVVKEYADYVRCQIPTGRSFSPRVLAALVRALDHDHVYVRTPVAEALAYFNEPAARDALLDELLEDIVPGEVRDACLDGLTHHFQHCDDAKAQQRFRYLLLWAARIAGRKGASITKRELTELALGSTAPQGNWLADPLALEVVTPLSAGGGRILCEKLDSISAPPIEPLVLEKLQRLGPQDTGPDLEPKYRVAHLAQFEDDTLHVRLTPTTWTLGKSFHNAVLADPKHFSHTAEGSWIEPLPLGTAMLPGLAVVHAIVLTSDGKIMVAQRSEKVGYARLHWSVSFEEQINSRDFTHSFDAFTAAAQRGFLEEFGELVPPECIQPLSAVIELNVLNLGVVLLLQPKATAVQLRDLWRAEPRPTHYWEASEVSFLDAQIDVLQQISLAVHSLGDSLRFATSENTTSELHPTSRIRCAMLARWLKAQN